jgi:hypothetical protein
VRSRGLSISPFHKRIIAFAFTDDSERSTWTHSRLLGK